MKSGERNYFNLDKLNSIKRKTIRVSQESLVKKEYLNSDKPLPLVICPTIENLNLADWAKSNQPFIESELLKHGAILFRGFDVRSAPSLERFIQATNETVLEYTERSSPRTQVAGNIYTSTDHPPSESIFLHNEQSYNCTFPQRIYFFCLLPAQQGGETPLADTRKVFERINPGVREDFIKRNYAYVRNFGDGCGLSWQTAFQTEERSVVEQYCHNNDISFEWKGKNRLRTSQVRRTVARHPQSGVLVWFNHLTFFHISTLGSSIRAELLSQFGEENLPNNTYYGDGSKIDSFLMDELREAYIREKTTFQWQENDVLLVDNMLVAHGRNPYVGPRTVLVGMSKPCGWKEV